MKTITMYCDKVNELRLFDTVHYRSTWMYR